MPSKHHGRHKHRKHHSHEKSSKDKKTHEKSSVLKVPAYITRNPTHMLHYAHLLRKK